jgi:hypothetical protein
MHSLRKIVSMLITTLLLLGLTFSTHAQQPESGVTVEEQEVENGTVTVQQVVIDQQGWVVIHAQENGAPGPVIGYSQVTQGEHTDVTVEIDERQATDTLHAMLHIDAGEPGVFEFPGADSPLTVNGRVVVEPFQVIGLQEAPAGEETPGADETPEAGETPTEPPAVAPGETPDETPGETPDETPTEMDETPTTAPDETPTEMDETPAMTPDETPEEPAATPEETPDTELPELGGEGPGPWSIILLVLGGLIVLGAIALSVARRRS